MKYLFRYFIPALVLIIFTATAPGQTTLNGFLNIPFGVKMETAKKLLLQKSGVKFIRQFDRMNYTFSGLSMGAYKVDTCMLIESIQDDRFEASNLIFYSKAGLLEEIFEIHCAKYGNPTTKYTVNNDVFYRWEFPVRGSKNVNSITLRSNSASDYFVLSYSGIGTLTPGWLQQYSHKIKSSTDNFQ